MIGSVVKSIDSFVTSQSFVGNYGGLVRLVESKQEISDSGSFKTVRYPVTCNAGSDCTSLGYQTDLVPNSMFKSIVYFESLQDVRAQGISGPKASHYTFAGSIRLVTWLNLPELGILECHKASEFAACYLKSGIIGRHELQEPYSNSFVEIGLPSIVERNVSTFNRYTYPSEVFNNLGGPFDWFHMDFPFTLTLGRDCIECPTEGSPVKCVTV